jgi:CHAD domain-containing protein
MQEMTHDLQTVQRLGEKLRQNLQKCAADPDVDAVHDTRTGTRRLQATVESLMRELPAGDGGAAVQAGATSLLRQLKKIRHAAGPVRDLDVHRKLLEKLVERALDADREQRSARIRAEAAGVPPHPEDREGLETEAAGRRMSGVEQQADDLDAWLKHRRNHLAHGLQSEASGMLARLDKRLEEFAAAIRSRRGRGPRKKPPGVVALDSFARLATEMQILDAGNLHDFRKGAKEARYVAELAAQGDQHAQQVGSTLKKLQDEIGDWHDWLVLAEEAHTALGDSATELPALLESERERHFVAAMKTAAKLRGRLMGEWLATRPRSASSVRRSVHPAAGE